MTSKKKSINSGKLGNNVVGAAGSKRTVLADNKHFLAIMVLFVGVSLYAITSFVTSNNEYFDKMFAAVTVLDGAVINEEPLVEVDRKNPFADLSTVHPNYDAVIALYYEGIVNGYADSSFKPDKKVNRAEFAKMLVEATDIDYTVFPPADLNNCFNDVKDLPVDWFAPSVCAAKYKGWVNGYDWGDFVPNKNIVKAEGLKIVLKAFNFKVPANDVVKESPYSDVTASDWFYGVAYATKDNDLVAETEFFVPSWELTRGDVAQVIYNAMVKKGVMN